MRISRHIFRQADFISTAIDNLLAALRDGALLVVLIVFAFLVNGRATTITLLAIPLSLIAAILAMKAFGATINTMTLGGMAITVGALVDDAIIVVENVVRRLRENARLRAETRRGLMAVIYEATHEIRGSIVFATLIIILVFLPLFFLAGVEGRLLQPLGFAYIVSLAASLLVAITVTPVLCALWLPRSRVLTQAQEPRLVHWLKTRYEPLLAAVLRRWKLVGATAFGGLVAALVALWFAGQSSLPDFNEGTLTRCRHTPWHRPAGVLGVRAPGRGDPAQAARSRGHRAPYGACRGCTPRMSTRPRSTWASTCRAAARKSSSPRSGASFPCFPA